MKKKFLIFSLLFANNLLTWGQVYEKYFIRPVTSAGPQKITNVRETIQDNFGFLWIGTQDGLFRYGSKILDIYTTGLTGKHNLITPDVRSIVEDSLNSRIWIAGTSGGISVVNSVTGVIEYKTILYKNGKLISANRLCINEKKVFIASSVGVYSINKTNYEVEKLDGLDTVNVSNLLIIEDKLIAFTQFAGIFCYDLKKEKIISRVPIKIYSSTNDLSYFEAKADKGSFYVSTSDGIKGFTLKTESIIYEKELFDFLPLEYNKHAFGLCIDKKKTIWYSNENNLVKVNLKTREYSIIKNASTTESPVWLNSIYTLFCDDENNIWLGCQQGLAYLKNNPYFFENFSSKNMPLDAGITQSYYIHPENDSSIYICAENGLFKTNINNGHIYPIDYGVSYDYYYRDNSIGAIVSNTDGLFIINKKQFVPFESVHKEFKSIGKVRANSIIKIDHIYIFGTENHKGIIIWDSKKKSVKHFNGVNSEVFNEPIINTVVKIKKDKVAILGDKYFSVFDINTYKNVIYNFKKNYQINYSLFFDIAKIKDKYYIASYGNGVIIVDSNFVIEKEISTINGLSNNGVYRLLPWEDSLLFITTNEGLNCLDVSNNKLNIFYESDGLHNNIFEETSGNVFNNKIYAGGKEGFTIIHPKNINSQSKAPAVYFTALNIEIADGNKIDTFNLKSKVFIIPVNSIQTTLGFMGINYSNPQRTIYKYRIIEQSKNWISLNNQNFVTLIGLAPGTYHLQVKAANEDGIWSEPIEISLRFLPKWYQTWWFYLLIALTVAGILYALYRYRIRQIKKQHQIRKNIATDLHDDLGSTLNSVKVFTNLAISGVKQEESLQQVKDNLTEATMSLRDMIWVLDDSLDTVDELVTRLKQFGIPITAASNMDFLITADSDVNSRQLTKEEKRNLFLICKEAINNSIKYSGATQITADILPAAKKIQIAIADNGKGFDEATVKKGYGLKNMQYRAGQIKYKVALQSEPGLGTRIFIQPV